MKSFGLRFAFCAMAAAVAGDARAQVSTPPVPKLGGSPAVPPEGPRVLRGIDPTPENQPPLTGYVQPFINVPVDAINAMVNRAVALGDIAPNTQRIADTLEKGFPNIFGPDSLGNQAKKKAVDNGIRFAQNPNDPAQPAQPQPAQPNGNAQDNAFKQTMDEINKIFKTQADLIRSIDVGSVNRANSSPGVIDGGVVVANGRTGMQLGLISPELYPHLKIQPDQGLLIKEVYPNTPAEAAGYKKNDILLELNGRKVPSNFPDFLQNIMGRVKINTPISGVVLRAGERIEVGPMSITDRRVVPPLVNERLPDLSTVIGQVPGINSDLPSGQTPNTNRIPEIRIIRNGLITEIVPYTPPAKK